MAKCLVRSAGGFSNRRFERRFCPLLPTGAKVGRAGARNLPLQAAERNGAAGGNKGSAPRPQARNGLSCRRRQWKKAIIKSRTCRRRRQVKVRPAGPRKILEECSGKFYSMSGSGDRRKPIPHFGIVTTAPATRGTYFRKKILQARRKS